ncbi:transposase [Aphanizomenon flos-aquae FACHB-1416]|jgi:transposase|uniref:Transposase n=1 Tax=Aphanizomenon flos-aquae FACHB-1249 TaxID=2692889 RepID=A0ABR8ISG3_APHFL|nr:transposase [Aphanizomenon flos-aquae FACHB-1171]MBD2556563.1 transposase [Aphanizomenon flos-aquae FACHB-1290]MBD2631143.1 transposase [Aphanizomenon sp. FACHB-1399]MBD2642041.1 transposase [Aphanizomenon sp. FACHB-1401]MBD2657019.1 transposase [Aphanizomenon flos-aquae FACHB-1265]MBD2672556.1 transposase [Aphanizomenon flos-aquae FACHB-1416]MBD2684978.1 transposase [Aphanizomenon flos-aquae FACHB-1249]MBD2696696.1 transposase [Aphanizomenon flos-aquae FACHB-1287]
MNKNSSSSEFIRKLNEYNLAYVVAIRSNYGVWMPCNQRIRANKGVNLKEHLAIKNQKPLKSSKKQGRVNIIAAYSNGKLFAPFTVEGACNRSVFETWLETCLLPSLKPGQIVIANNAIFHKGGLIKELIEAAGCQLKYLPPYSPDLNKIERCWSWLKSRIRKQLIQFDSFRDAMEDAFRTAS